MDSYDDEPAFPTDDEELELPDDLHAGAEDDPLGMRGVTEWPETLDWSDAAA
jgi:hypothetical protein